LVTLLNEYSNRLQLALIEIENRPIPKTRVLVGQIKHKSIHPYMQTTLSPPPPNFPF